MTKLEGRLLVIQVQGNVYLDREAVNALHFISGFKRKKSAYAKYKRDYKERQSHPHSHSPSLPWRGKSMKQNPADYKCPQSSPRGLFIMTILH